jgi:hypothetical protein
MVQQVQAMRPRSAAEYSEPRRTLPHPCFTAVGSALITMPLAWALAGISVLYVAWHFIPQLVQAWQQLGIPRGMPPCPACWQHEVQLDGGRQLTVQECYKQLPATQVKKLQQPEKDAAGKVTKPPTLGTLKPHGWLRTPYRAASLGKPELLMAHQYKCVDCPGEAAA